MAIDGILLSGICSELQNYLPCKINKIQQVSSFELVLLIRANRSNHKLFISLHSQFNRINISNENYTTLETPSNFVMLLRKKMDGAIITKIEQVGLDRILLLSVEARNELGDIEHLKLSIELMGKYANIVLIDEQNKIIDALKRIPPFENNQRTIHPGATFVLPAPHLDKVNPYLNHQYDLNLPLYKQFHGFSPLLSKEIQYRLMHQQSFASIMDEIKQSRSLYICEVKDQMQFHLIPLLHLETKVIQYPLMNGFDIMFANQEAKVRIKSQSGDLFKTVKKELNKNKTKLPKLHKALDEALDLDKYREYGDLIFAYMHQIKKAPSITLTSFETNEDVIIPIDMRYDLKYNANKYYQKYHKLRRAQEVLLEQISLCEKEIEYFESLEVQLSYADVKDSMEIRDELVSKGYLKAKQSKIRKKKKNELPHYDTFVFDNYTIYVGKNNLQNDYVTWKLGRKNDTWFHTKDLHGSHVIVKSEDLNEEMIRNAAMLAAYYSQGRYSSSVAVNYCEVKYLKKIPGHFGSFVSLSSYKTIYIDPESDHIQSLIDHHRQ